MKREELLRPSRWKKSTSSFHKRRVDHLRLFFSLSLERRIKRKEKFIERVRKNLLKYDILTLFIFLMIRKISHVWCCCCSPLNKSKAIHHNFLLQIKCDFFRPFGFPIKEILFLYKKRILSAKKKKKKNSLVVKF